MPLFRFSDRLILFVHIPKTGGTSIERFLSSIGKTALLHGRRIPGLSMTPQHIHARIYQRILPEGFYDYSFCIVRNPFDRLVSEYNMRNTDDEVTFDEWTSRVFSEYENDPFMHDNHIRPQKEFIIPGMDVFRFEDGIRHITERVAEILGVEPPEQDFHERKSPPTPITASERTLRLIEEFYAPDFDTFGYGREDSVRMGRGPAKPSGPADPEHLPTAPAAPVHVGAKKPLTIALFVPWITKGRGGTESVGAMVANGMAERGHRVNIHTFDDNAGDPTWPLRPEVTVTCHPETDSEAADNQLLLRLVLQQPNLIVGLYMNRLCFRYVYCGYKLKCPVLLSEHTDPGFADETGVLTRGEREEIFAAADAVHLLTDEFREELPPHLQAQVSVIPNTVPPAENLANPAGDEGEERTVLCVARLVPRKNVDTLIAAFAKAEAATVDDWRLQIVGYGTLLNPLRALADSLGIGSKVVFEGRQDSAYPFYERAQLAVLPSYAEGLPLVPLEAMAHGLPCIGFSDCSGIPLLIEDEVSGLHVERDDQVNSLAAAMTRLMEDAALRAAMGAAAKARYDARFTPERVLDQWEALIRRTAASGPRSQELRSVGRMVRSRVAIHAALEKGPTAYFVGRSGTAAEA